MEICRRETCQCGTVFSPSFGDTTVHVALLTVLPTDLRDGTSRVKSRRHSGSTGWVERCRRALLDASQDPAGFWKAIAAATDD